MINFWDQTVSSSISTVLLLHLGLHKNSFIYLFIFPFLIFVFNYFLLMSHLSQITKITKILQNTHHRYYVHRAPIKYTIEEKRKKK